MVLHMIKLCVGCDTVEELADWRLQQDTARPWILRTRQTPKRAAELIAGGSVYRVFKGQILCRQAILAVGTRGEGPAARCEVTLDPELVLTLPTPGRAFQGWRYLKAEDAPADLGVLAEGAAPPDLARRLREIGAW